MKQTPPPTLVDDAIRAAIACQASPFPGNVFLADPKTHKEKKFKIPCTAELWGLWPNYLRRVLLIEIALSFLSFPKETTLTLVNNGHKAVMFDPKAIYKPYMTKKA